MEESKLYRARVQVVEAMEQGLPWYEAVKLAGLQISQSTAYRLCQRMRQGGKQALQEGRHRHPAKLRGKVREFLEEACRQAPHTPSHQIQAQLAERLEFLPKPFWIQIIIRSGLRHEMQTRFPQYRVSLEYSEVGGIHYQLSA